MLSEMAKRLLQAAIKNEGSVSVMKGTDYGRTVDAGEGNFTLNQVRELVRMGHLEDRSRPRVGQVFYVTDKGRRMATAMKADNIKSTCR